jgi:outer membrane receptor protein involved in Fe transport
MTRRPLGALLATTALSLPAAASAQTAGYAEPDEIVVTARKRVETLQDVPVSVSVVTDRAIDQLNLNAFQDIARVTAGLTFDDEFGRDSNRPVIRGQANVLGESGIAFFIDGVYVTGSLADYNVQEIERIEIVKGPQSALYGRNTYSGAINIVTAPAAGPLRGEVLVDVSEYDRYELTGTVRGSLTDTLAAALTARYYEFGGEFTNRFDGEKVGDEKTQALSGVVEWTPSDVLEIRARAYYAESEDGQPAIFAQPASANNCFTDNGALYAGGGRYFCGVIEPGQVNTDFSRQITEDAGTQIDTFQGSLRADYVVSDRATLTSITGFNSRDVTQRTDGDYQPTSFQTAVFTPGGFPFAGFADGPPFTYGFVGSTVDFTFENEALTEDFSQEVRFAFEEDRYGLLAGVYYFDQSIESQDIRELPEDAFARASASFGAAVAQQQALCAASFLCESIIPFFGPSLPESRDLVERDIENTAVFGSLRVDPVETVSVTFEGRYQVERIAQQVTAQDAGVPGQDVTRAKTTFKDFLPRVTADWQPTDDHLFYAVYAEGTKPGGFNGALAIQAGLPTFDEERATSIEVGVKNTLLDGQLTANLALYTNEVEGYQLTQNARVDPARIDPDDQTDLGQTQSAIRNVGDADLKGGELEFLFRPAAIEGLTLVANWAYVDTEFTEGTDENQGILNDVLDDGLSNASLGLQFPDIPGDTTPVFGSIVGKSLPRAPENVVFVDADYQFAAPGLSDWFAFVGANYSYQDSAFIQVANEAETGSAEVVNARLGVGNDRILVRLYANNLFDEDAILGGLRFADGDDSFKRSFNGTRRRGRHFGIEAQLRF